MEPIELIDKIAQPLVNKLRTIAEFVAIHPEFDRKSRHMLSAQLALCSANMIVFIKELDRGPLPENRNQAFHYTVEETSALISQIEFFIEHLQQKRELELKNNKSKPSKGAT